MAQQSQAAERFHFLGAPIRRVALVDGLKLGAVLGVIAIVSSFVTTLLGVPNEQMLQMFPTMLISAVAAQALDARRYPMQALLAVVVCAAVLNLGVKALG